MTMPEVEAAVTGHFLGNESLVHTNLAAEQCACHNGVVGAPPKSFGTGNTCPRCGGMMVQTGSCTTCTSCGESGGCG